MKARSSIPCICTVHTHTDTHNEVTHLVSDKLDHTPHVSSPLQLHQMFMGRGPPYLQNAGWDLGVRLPKVRLCGSRVPRFNNYFPYMIDVHGV